jgi:hypothetical protein
LVRAASGLNGALAWLDDRLPDLLERLPLRELSLPEASLFCLVEHLAFRRTLETAESEALTACAQTFPQRPSTLATTYGFDRRADLPR